MKIRLIGWIAATFTLAIAILSSPFFLEWLVSSQKIDWDRIGNAGQAYGAASAMLSALAVLGVAITVIMQIREHSASKLQILRNQQFDLVAFAARDVYARAPLFGFRTATIRELSEMQIQQRMFLAMVMSYARTGYMLGAFSRAVLETEFLEFIFDTDVGRSWWSNNRLYMTTSAGQTRRERDFFDITDEAYKKALSSGSSSPLFYPKGRRLKYPPSFNERFGVILFMATGAAISIFTYFGIIRRNKEGDGKCT